MNGNEYEQRHDSTRKGYEDSGASLQMLTSLGVAWLLITSAGTNHRFTQIGADMEGLAAAIINRVTGEGEES